MPGPPPPPPGAPPPLCPPPPPVFISSPVKSGGDSRGALLSSIRQGARLKKTETNDRSAPVVAGNKTSNTNSNSNIGGGGNVTNTTSSATLPNGLGLGGLFAGGMPKLRPTGKHLGSVRISDTNSRPAGLSLPQNGPVNFADVQSALKKQMANDSNRNRGPPPPAPVRNISQSTENLQNSGKYHARNGSATNGLHLNTSTLHRSFGSSPQQTPTSPQPPNHGMMHANSSTLHRKANSSANLSVFEAAEVPPAINYSVPMRPVNRKPHLAPKPPVNGKPAAPPKKLVINGRPSSINRAQSMRSPRSPSPQSPEDASYHAKFGTVRNMSSMLDKTLAHNVGQRLTRPVLNGRPTAPPPSIPPQQTPPPPPSSKMAVKPPNHAPPPPPNVIPQPPSHAPPPPPHRTQPQLPMRAPPAVPTNINAPPPPPRHSSMRDVAGRRTSPLDLEVRFKNDFHTTNQFSLPAPYRGIPKFYSSKTVANKQQAPLPPNHIQLNSRLWDSSTC